MDKVKNEKDLLQNLIYYFNITEYLINTENAKVLNKKINEIKKQLSEYTNKIVKEVIEKTDKELKK